jgi:RNA polymerase sigma-70 factor (ECF subfamily)
LKALENQCDERLLIEAAQHDPARFAELYERHFARVYAFIVRRVENREEAQDLTAQVFYEALAGIRHFQWRGAPFIAWLVGIATNLVAKHWARLGKRPQTGETDVIDVGSDSRIEHSALIFQLVETLPADQRLVIRRRFVERCSLREIADELQRSEGAIKQLQFRALQNLRARAKETK